MKSKALYPGQPGYASGADTPLFNQDKIAEELKEFSQNGGGDTSGPPQVSEATPAKNKRKFQEFHKDNPHVYTLFKKFAFQVINRGFDHFGTNCIIERIRWETAIKTSDLDFKINNNHAPYYARLFEKDYPEHKDFFRKRQVEGELDPSTIPP